jgi:hypothetical protein
LAIITMQMMPKISWPQRVASDARVLSAEPAAIAITSSPIRMRFFIGLF